MQGTILQYNKETHKGLISGHDGTRYNFARADWTTSKVEPREGLTVDFDVDESDEKKAAHIIVLKSGSNGNVKDKSKFTAGVLALFLGGFGVHKFYLGQSGKGFLYLVSCWTLIPAAIAFIEFCIFMFMSDDDFHRKYNN